MADDVRTDPPKASGSPERSNTAQERSRGEQQHRRSEIIQQWSLVVAWIALIVVFGLTTDSFLTTRNFESLLGSQAVLLTIALGLTLALTTGDYDLSIGGVLSLSAMVIAVLNVQHGWPIGLAILAALGVGLVFGMVNAGVAVLVGIDSLIVTLGTGSVAGGLTLWIGDSQTVSGVSTKLVDAVVANKFLGVSVGFYYALALCLLIWYVVDFTSLGRRMLFTGLGIRVAKLSGINVSRIRFGAMTISALMGAAAGILYVGTSGSANPGAGEPLLLPAFAAAFLGMTAIRPGRFNPWGTFVAVYFLATGINGLALLGVPSFVQSLFYGGALVTAVVLAKLARRRYERAD